MLLENQYLIMQQNSTVDRQDEFSAKHSNDTASGYVNAVKHTCPSAQQDCSGNSRQQADSENYITVTKNETSWKKTIIGDRKDIADLQVL